MLHSINWSSALPFYALAVVVGYLIGSIPFGVILTNLAGTGDIRSIGSGNIGATNVLRTGRKGLAAATLLGDMLKGTVAVVLVNALWGRDAAILAALAAFLGHLFPVWLKFKGGKGVATYIGLLIGFGVIAKAWLAALAFCALWLLVAIITRYSSLSGLIASLAAPLVLWVAGEYDLARLFVVLTALIFLTHRANIARLLAGTEGKIGRPKTVAPAEPTES